MREFVSTEESNESSPRGIDTPDDNSQLVFDGDSPQKVTEGSWPNAALVIKLWQIFLDRVNPLTKVIHVPSFQPYVVEATNGPQDIPDSMAALMLTIFLMAAVSLSGVECESILGDPKPLVLDRFTSRVRQSLQRLGIFQTNDLAVLQALVLYLVCSRPYQVKEGSPPVLDTDIRHRSRYRGGTIATVPGF